MKRDFLSYLSHECKPVLKVRNFGRLLLFGLLIFNFLNLIRVLEFTLQFTWRGLFITALATCLILEGAAYAYYRTKGHVLHGSVWLIVMFALGLDATADIFHFYQRFGWWDQAVHTLNSSLICFALFIAVSAFWINRPSFDLLRKPARLHLGLFIAAMTTMTLSALYEIEEYTEDMIFGTQRLGPGTDTANDLLCNAGGILIAVITLWFIMTRKRAKS